MNLIKTIIEAGLWAPSACNFQLTEFVVVSDAKIKKELSTFSTKKVEWAPSAIVVFYDSRFTEKNQANVQSSAAAIQNMCLAAHELGLGTLWIGGFESEKISEILNVPSMLTPLAIVLVGFPDEDPHPPKRRLLNTVLHLNKFHRSTPRYPDSLNPDTWTVRELMDYRGRISEVYGKRFVLEPYFYEVRQLKVDIERFVREFMEEKSRSCNLLDVMTYGGNIVRNLHQKSLKITGFDFVENQLLFLKEHLSSENYSFVCGSSNNFPFKENTFDIITCLGKLEHHPSPKNLIKEINNVLSDDGMLLILVQNKYSPHNLRNIINRLKNKTNVYENNPYYKMGPSSPLSMKKIRSWLEKEGLEIFETKGVTNYGKTSIKLKLPFYNSKFIRTYFGKYFLIIARKKSKAQ
jgi:2-polyprenyl-3-methyl-5-hydroxy-6-metoxy-1,4-benzoquinol methylase